MGKCPDQVMLARRRITVQVIVDILLWLAVAIPVLYLFTQGSPAVRGFYCDDPTLSYPYRPDTISTTVLIISGVCISILVVVIVEVLNCIETRCPRPCHSMADILYCVKGYGVFLVGFILQELVVESVKNQLGFLRPNFFDVCRPQFNRTLCPSFITEYTCTGSDHEEDELRDIRQSFPSGHSAFSMYIAMYFCLYIHGRLQIRYSQTLKFMLQCGLVFISLLCGFGRIKDNKHHPRDVIAGFLLGAVVAIAVYKTIGKRLLPRNDPISTEPSTQAGLTHSNCCSCTSSSITPEPQTPSPLLQNDYNEYINGHSNTQTNNSDRDTSINNNTNDNKTKLKDTTKLKDIPFSVRRPKSSPIKLTVAYEDV